MNKKIVFAVMLSAASMSISAQKLSGDISTLKEQKEVNVVLDFSEMLVNRQPEESYTASRTKDMYKEDAVAWLSDWNERLRKDGYAILTRDLNKATTEKGFSVGNYPDANLTIIVKVVNIKNSFCPSIEADVRFVRTRGSATFATIERINAKSFISRYAPGEIDRIIMSLGALGDDIGKTISKNLN